MQAVKAFIVGLRGLRASHLQAIDTYELMGYNNNKGMLWPRGLMKCTNGPSQKMATHLDGLNPIIKSQNMP